MPAIDIGSVSTVAGLPKRGEGMRIILRPGFPSEIKPAGWEGLPIVRAEEPLEGEEAFVDASLLEAEVAKPEEVIAEALKGEVGAYPSDRAAYLKGEDGKVHALINVAKGDAPLQLVELYWPPIEFANEVVVTAAKAQMEPEIAPLKLGEWFDGDWFPYVATSKDEGSRRLVTHIVLEPDVVDKQGDIYSAAVIEAAAHDYLANYNKNVTRPAELSGTRIDVQHYIVGVDVDVVESWIAPCEMTLNGQVIRKGTWIVTLRVRSDDLWAKVLAGNYPGISIGGMARLVLLDGFKMPE